MKIDKYKNSKWLKKFDIEKMEGSQRLVTIDAITEELVGDDLKPVCYFAGIQKGWPMNTTALNELAAITGSDDTDGFVGQRVEIYIDPTVTYAGKRVGGIKIAAVKKAGTKAADAPPHRDEPPADAYDDDEFEDDTLQDVMEAVSGS